MHTCSHAWLHPHAGRHGMHHHHKHIMDQMAEQHADWMKTQVHVVGQCATPAPARMLAYQAWVWAASLCLMLRQAACSSGRAIQQPCKGETTPAGSHATDQHCRACPSSSQHHCCMPDISWTVAALLAGTALHAALEPCHPHQQDY